MNNYSVQKAVFCTFLGMTPATNDIPYTLVTVPWSISVTPLRPALGVTFMLTSPPPLGKNPLKLKRKH